MRSISPTWSATRCSSCWFSLLRSLSSSCVLDGNHGLRGKILDQFDLLIGEWADLLTENTEGTDQLTFSQHRNS